MTELRPLAGGKSYWVAREPKSETYRSLLGFLALQCETFSLVYYNPVGQPQQQYWNRLLPCLLDSRPASTWPGTEIWPRAGKPLPTLAFYHLQGLGLSVLAEAPGLYSWQQPERPSDLAVYGDAGIWWLGSVAHERRARLFVADHLAPALKAIRGLKLRPVAPGE